METNEAFNENLWYLLKLCFSNGLCIMNNFFLHRDVHKYTWYRPTIVQKFLIALFCQICFPMNVRVTRVAKLSTDHHLVVFSLQISKPRPNRKLRRSIVANKIKWEALADKDVMKQFASSMETKYR